MLVPVSFEHASLVCFFFFFFFSPFFFSHYSHIWWSLQAPQSFMSQLLGPGPHPGESPSALGTRPPAPQPAWLSHAGREAFEVTDHQ